MAIIKEKGTISFMSEVQSGVAQSGNPWYRQTIVVDVAGYNGSFRKVALQASGNVVGDLENATIGDKVEISYQVTAREYNGRWYNDVKAWGCREYVAGQAAQGGQGAADETGTVAQNEAQAGAKGKTPAAAPAAVQTRIKQMAEAAASGAEGKEGEEDDLPF
jgi:hypothetical protein